MAQIRQLRLLPRALLMQHGLRVGRRRVRIVAPPFAVEVDRGIPGILGGAARLGGSAPEAFQAGPGFQLGPVHREVFIREQAGCPGLGPHGVEERGGDIARQQPIPILGKRRGMPDGVVHIQPDEPPEQKVVIEFLHQQPFAPDRVEHLQHQGAQQLLGRDRRTTCLSVQVGEPSRHRVQRLVRQRPDRSQRMVGRHPVFRRQVAEHVGGLLIVSAHDGAPFSVGSMVVRRDRSVDPISRTFSAAC